MIPNCNGRRCLFLLSVLAATLMSCADSEESPADSLSHEQITGLSFDLSDLGDGDVRVSLTNHGSVPASITGWGVGSPSELLVVEQNGQAVDFVGVLRSLSAAPVLQVAPGEALTQDFDLLANYQVGVDDELVVRVILDQPIAAQDGASIAMPAPLHLQISGEMMGTKLQEETAALEFASCSTDESNALTGVMYGVSFMLDLRMSNVSTETALIQRWFPPASLQPLYSDLWSQRTHPALITIQNWVHSFAQRFTCHSTETGDCTPPGPGRMVLAYVQANGNVTPTLPVNICPAFWGLDQDQGEQGTGQSKVGVVTHELSHLWAGTQDIAYGKPACHALASYKQHNNAANFQYYVMGAPY